MTFLVSIHYSRELNAETILLFASCPNNCFSHEIGAPFLRLRKKCLFLLGKTVEEPNTIKMNQ
jgi:hypothetical protein